MEKMFRMTVQMFQQYKRVNNTVPRCVSCGVHLLVDNLIDRFQGRKIKYVCGVCAKKKVIVFQYPNSRKPFKGNKRNDVGSRHDDYIHEIATYTSQ